MTFEEKAYKERELFAIINKTRDAQFDEITGYGRKELRRDDFEQQKLREDTKVSFQASTGFMSGPARGQAGLQHVAGGGSKGSFSRNRGGLGVGKISSFGQWITRKEGSMNIEEDGSTFTGANYRTDKPSAAEKQGFVPENPISLIAGKKKGSPFFGSNKVK